MAAPPEMEDVAAMEVDPEQEEDLANSESDSDSEERAAGKGRKDAYKCKPRRKACQKPESSDQKRQAFSKRKRGLILKSYQLYKLTDAKVFVFVVNDKGSSWAYASPGFGHTLSGSHLRQMREYAKLPCPHKLITEAMPHPKMDEADKKVDDRAQVHFMDAGGSPQPQQASPNLPSPAAAQPQLQLQPSPAPPPPPGARAVVGAPAPPPSANPDQREAMGPPPARQQPAAAPAVASAAAAAAVEPASGGQLPRRAPNSKYIFQLQLEEETAPRDPPPTNDIIITPSGRRMAAAIGINLPSGAGGLGLAEDEHALLQQHLIREREHLREREREREMAPPRDRVVGRTHAGLVLRAAADTPHNGAALQAQAQQQHHHLPPMAATPAPLVPQSLPATMQASGAALAAGATAQPMSTVMGAPARPHVLSSGLPGPAPLPSAMIGAEAVPDKSHCSTANDSMALSQGRARTQVHSTASGRLQAGQVVQGTDGQLYRVLVEVPAAPTYDMRTGGCGLTPAAAMTPLAYMTPPVSASLGVYGMQQ